jgi:lysophospholipase L1-like esterase
LYGKRVRYQTKADSFVRKVAMKASAARSGVDPFATTADVFPLFQDRKVLWQRSVDEYSMRYRKFNAVQYSTQQRFLQDLLTTCHDRQIQVLLVNMPLTEDNRKLMPQGLYKSYLDNLQTVAANNAVPLLDLSKEQFPDQCYYDTVHLNEAGAKLFQAQLQKVLKANADGRMTASLPKQSL